MPLCLYVWRRRYFGLSEAGLRISPSASRAARQIMRACGSLSGSRLTLLIRTHFVAYRDQCF
jgi:hypothetical protein